MDNVTHSAIGMALGELAHQHCQKRNPNAPKSLGTLLWATGIAASNVPDLDFVYTPITKGPIGYLLHHRGHTHTLGLLLPQTLLLLFFVWALARIFKIPLQKKHYAYVGVVALIGLALHILFDGLNSYGVHPWWPIDNRWVYGDTLFIIEPLLWLSLIAGLVNTNMHRWGQYILWAFAVLSFVLGYTSGLVPIPILVFLFFWLWGIYFASSRLPLEKKMYPGVAAALITVVGFAVTSKLISKQISESLRPQQLQIKDLTLSPLPANPFCWTLIVIEKKEKTYALHTGLYTPFSAGFNRSVCANRGFGRTVTLKKTPIGLERAFFFGSYEASLDEFQKLASNNCVLAEFLKFARAPFYEFISQRVLIGDLRYDHNEDLDFAEMLVDRSPNQCPQRTPNWTPPRQDLLENRR